MTDAAVLRTRIIPPGSMSPLLLTAGTLGAAVAVGAAALGVSWFISVPVLLVALLVVARRGVYDAEYRVDTAGLHERLVPVAGGEPSERSWTWPEVASYTLDREPSGAGGVRSMLLVRLPGYEVRLREPLGGGGRDEHARFVDRFVGYVTGDVIPGDIGRGGPAARTEAEHRQPLTSGEAPQLRRTLANQPAARPSVPGQVPFLDTVPGRAVAAVGALAIAGLIAFAVSAGAGAGSWYSAVFVLVPAGLWLAWRAVRRPR